MSTVADVVVAGAGHNSLVTAAYLARAGLEVLVLEERPVVGGNTATEELTLPGFLHDSCSTAHNLIQASPALGELRLVEDYGLEYLHPDPVVHVVFGDGESITQWRDLDRTCAELARFSARDAESYRRLIADYDAAKGVFGAYRNNPAGRAPRPDEALDATWRKRLAMSAWDVIRAEFEDPHIQAFMLWMAFMTVQPCDRPGTGQLAYSLVYGRQQHSWTLPRGGSAELPLALVRLIEDRGGSVVTGARVGGLVLEGGKCVGVETEGGETYRARRAVVSTVHVKHLVEMAPREAWGEDFLYGVDRWREGVCLFPAHYATTEAPTFATADGPVTPVAAGVAPSVDRLLRVGSDVGRGLLALDDPPLLVVCGSVADESRAPAGQHALKVIGFHPYELADGGAARWEERKEEAARANFEQLARFAPNMTADAVLATLVKSPPDLERMNAHNWHGTCHGGDMSPAQSGLLRFAPRTPVEGLYQTGGTTHPGGSVSAAPGRNTAIVLLEDLGTSLEEVVAGA
ncbi:MAG TPA: NAD(P)/FAD-dependent oxidoreductase [Gaiellaceae bacterium]|nr:NAD(P)/FAD-dependent oxidoreductase [Gaiellaceae bacterium]